MSIDDTKTVVTPEQVAVTYTLAGIGTRFAAMLVDTLIQVIAGLILWLVVFQAGGMGTALGLSRLDEEGPAWLLALAIIVGFGIVWAYFIFWEAVWNGQTPGKRMAGIRVIRDQGYPIDFRAAFLRNICRYVDFLPFLYGVGTISIFLSKDSKRLGDYVAGTVVVIPQRQASASQASPPPAQGEYRLLGDPSLLNLRAITREQFGAIDRFLDRRQELPESVSRGLARKMAVPLMSLIGMDAPADEAYPYESFLVELASAYRERMSA